MAELTERYNLLLYGYWNQFLNCKQNEKCLQISRWKQKGKDKFTHDGMKIVLAFISLPQPGETNNN